MSDQTRKARAASRAAHILLRADGAEDTTYQDIIDVLDTILEKWLSAIEEMDKVMESYADLGVAVDRRVDALVAKTERKRGHLRLVSDVYEGETVA